MTSLPPTSQPRPDAATAGSPGAADASTAPGEPAGAGGVVPRGRVPASGRHASREIGRRVAVDGTQSRAVATPVARRRELARQRSRATVDQSHIQLAIEAVAQPTTPRAPVETPRPRRRPPRFWRINLLQVMIWQTVIAAVLAVREQGPGLRYAVYTASAVAVLLTAIPVRGRWLYEWTGLWLRFRLRAMRTARAAARRAHDPLPALPPDAVVDTGEIDGYEAGILRHDMGIACVLRIEAPTGAVVSAQPVPALCDLIPEAADGSPPISIQFLTETLRAPTPWIAEDTAGRSYLELTDGVVPAAQRRWIVSQVLEAPEDFAPEGMHAALARATAQLQRRLDRAGVGYQLLRQEEVEQEVRSLIAGVWGPPGTSDDRWSRWQTGQMQHITFRLLNWPRMDDFSATPFFSMLHAVPALAIVTELAGRRAGAALDLEVIIRVVAPDQVGADAAVRALERLARSEGATIQRMDGEHCYGLRATAPYGGFAS
ncbi:type VII secretion protein EccE [Blastococcus sp. Marseille-P5729]|uniref:type VII secretion protein EccE n=1 Tax=Blastococcus sp. Marseille-P5729 TaxID=2086582 RepID=UPI000D0F300E|nr:type VII secretion protein EccE [Blastococcus sp. Marseille-P5729]